MVLLCFKVANAQTYWGEITHSVYGSVMQGTSGSNTVDVCFQVQNQSSEYWRITTVLRRLLSSYVFITVFDRSKT